MRIVGLTGSIGMGKSTVAAMLRDLGVPVFDADATVHELYAKGGAGAAAIAAVWPDAVIDGAVDRARLSAHLMGNPDGFARLNAIVHPLVREREIAVRAAAEAAGAGLFVVDVPLLFETGGRDRFDTVLVVSAPADIQRARVLARPGMTPEKFAMILAKQVPDAEKRAGADHVIDTGVGLDETRAQVTRLVEELSQ
ncbi:MAG: dephospho-CoA kinase [Alphaproteobacteria bacterium]|jgi:dephospho-CoA kinase|nr:dephospho-CoA kinase [Alphaproteobacteria bacterium]